MEIVTAYPKLRRELLASKLFGAFGCRAQPSKQGVDQKGCDSFYNYSELTIGFPRAISINCGKEGHVAVTIDMSRKLMAD